MVVPSVDGLVEPQVIDLAELRDAVEPKTAEPTDPVDFPKVEALRLSYKNIAEISNLNNFDSLKTLRLDNNIIERIEGLDHLTQLTWLDLSFNNIREITGLEHLKNLEDLSLYHNHIEEIKGLDGCKNLNVLSLGRNRVSDLKQINYLRKFPNLRCICLEHNKICQSDSYRQHTLAYLPHLTYLDYMLVDKKQVAHIQESYQLDELTELKEQEAEDALAKREEAERKIVEDKLRLSFLDTTMNLFDDLFNADDVPEHIQVLNCYPGLREEYKEKVTELLKTLYAQVQEKNEERLKKIAAFNAELSATEVQAEQDAAEFFHGFASKKKKVLAAVKAKIELEGVSDESMAALKTLLEELGAVEHSLMDIEIEYLTLVDEHVNEKESEVAELMKVLSTAGKEFFTFLEETEGTFKNDLLQGATSEMEVVNNQPELGLNPVGGGVFELGIGEEARRHKLLIDREGMTAALGSIADAHMLLIQTRDDTMQAQMSNWLTSFFDGKHKDLLQRNRRRIIEIKDMSEKISAEINALAVTKEGDAEDEDD